MTDTSATPPFDVCAVGDLEPNSARRVDVGDHRIAIVRLDDDVFAIGDRCSHADYSLAEGEIDETDKSIECWKHGSSFSLETGEPNCLPATKPVPVYDVTIADGRVLVTPREDSP